MHTSHRIAALVLIGAAALLGGCQQARQAPSAEARPEFDRGADRPPTARTLQLTARMQAAQGRENEAYAILRRLLVEHPDFIPAYAEMAEHHLRQNRPAEAERVLLEGLQRAPDDAILIHDLGMVSMMRGEFDQALEHFSRAADLAPGESRHRSNMAAALGLMGRYDESLAVYQQVLPPAQAHYNVSVLAGKRGDAERAEQEYQSAIRLDPTITGPAPSPSASTEQ